MKQEMNLQSLLTNDWADMLKDEFDKPYFIKLQDFLKDEYDTQTIYPSQELIFNALNTTSYKNTKVVIIGQDPYHNEHQAHGLSFSVPKGVTPPPSLKNIYKELHEDLDIDIPTHGELTSWAKQGVLLLNTVLTVRASQAHSHKNKGWEKFTNHIISLLNNHPNPIVFVLWGNPAQKLEQLITGEHHLILAAPHPSPLSSYRGFFGCKHFSKINDFMTSNASTPINWQIE